MPSDGSKKSNAQREIKSLKDSLYKDFCRTRGAAIKEQLASEQQSIFQWAKKRGRLLDRALWRKWTSQYSKLAEGQEHIVYLQPNKERVTKITKPPAYGLGGYAYKYLGYLELSNKLFSDDIRLEYAVKLYDDYSEEDFIALIISQPYIYGERPEELEIIKWFEKYGYKATQHPHSFSNELEGVLVDDAHTGNLIKVEGGELVPIDVLPELLTTQTKEKITTRLW